jgi:site-specific DNA recombinase
LRKNWTNSDQAAKCKAQNWSPTSITAIIKNECYIGNIIWGQIKYAKRNGKYTKKRMPREKWTLKENAHEPLVSRELFDAANKAHTGRWRPSTVINKGLSNPMAGVLKCEVCGYTMLYQPRPDRPNDVIRCVQPACKGVQKGSSINLVEQRLLDGLREFARELVIQTQAPAPPTNDEIPYKKILVESKQEEVAQLESQKSKLHDLLERGIYDVDTFLKREQNLAERINTIEEEIRNLTDEIGKEEMRNSTVSELLPQLQTVISEYEAADIESKNRLLKDRFGKGDVPP